jgi:hypothetical protein
MAPGGDAVVREHDRVLRTERRGDDLALAAATGTPATPAGTRSRRRAASPCATTSGFGGGEHQPYGGCVCTIGAYQLRG